MGNRLGIGRYLVEAHLRERRAVAELAAAHGVHRSWLYKLLQRAIALVALPHWSRAPDDRARLPRRWRGRWSRRSSRCVARSLRRDSTPAPWTIQWHLLRRHAVAPSVTSIWRTLRRAGLVTPQPRKRPRSSLIRFEAALPNECWQSDMTHWALGSGQGAEIVNMLDDHSRLVLASVALVVTTAVDVARDRRLARDASTDDLDP